MQVEIAIIMITAMTMTTIALWGTSEDDSSVGITGTFTSPVSLIGGLVSLLLTGGLVSSVSLVPPLVELSVSF